MKKFFISLLLLSISACSSRDIKVTEQKPDNSPLMQFFIRSEEDSIRASNVIEKHNIIEQLTHLKRMNNGGKKFYLLEKENITEMINSVTEGIYLDYFLINKYGEIIYTNNTDSLFASNVNEGFEGTPLRNCFLQKNSVHFEDISKLATGFRTYSLYVSHPVYKNGIYHGTIVLQIDIEIVNEVLEEGSVVINTEGLIKIAENSSKINSRVEENYLTKEEDKSFFSYKGISWIIIKKKDSSKITSRRQPSFKLF